MDSPVIINGQRIFGCPKCGLAACDCSFGEVETAPGSTWNEDKPTTASSSAFVTDGGECGLPMWNPASAKPPFLDPLLVAGVLEGESSEAVHEAFWDKRRFLSVRTHRNGDGGSRLRIDDARAWRFMPAPPKPNQIRGGGS